MNESTEPEQNLHRKLAAILAADIVSYSRHMEQDEVATLGALSRNRAIADPIIMLHGGRIASTAGDGLVAVFDSVVSAVECAVRIQEAIAARNSPMEERTKTLEYRIGVNVADVINEGHDVLGDGVNVAARLESICDPGGICISRGVFDYVGKHMPYTFDSLGEQMVKNLAEPLVAYGIRFSRGKAVRVADWQIDQQNLAGDSAPAPHTPSALPILAVAVSLFVVVVTAAGYLRLVDVLVVGGLAWLVLNLSAFCDNSLPTETKVLASKWLRPVSGKAWKGSDVFLELFECVFTRHHFSWVCIQRSVLLSVGAFVILFFAFMERGAVEWRIGELEKQPHHLEPWMRIAFGAMALCLCNVIADYLSLLETRVVLKLAKRYGMLPLFAFLDVLLTAGVFMFMVVVTLPLISLATGNIDGFMQNILGLWSNTPNVLSLCAAQNFARWFNGQPIDYIAMYVLPSVITTFLTTIWLVAAVVSAPALRAATWSRSTGLTMLGRFTDAARRPFTALGYAAALLIISLSLFSWPLQMIARAQDGHYERAANTSVGYWKKPSPDYCRTDPTVIPSQPSLSQRKS